MKRIIIILLVILGTLCFCLVLGANQMLLESGDGMLLEDASTMLLEGAGAPQNPVVIRNRYYYHR